MAASFGRRMARATVPYWSRTSLPLSGSSDPLYMTAVGGLVYFTADDAVHGRELWKSNGTAAGTVLVKDITPQGGSRIASLTNVNGLLYFEVRVDEDQIQLWKSDGTTTGTLLIKNFPTVDSYSSLGNFTSFGGKLYFTAGDSSRGRELWKSDGTAAGTVVVKDIYNGGLGSNPRELTVVGDTLYFSADDSARGRELWKTSGTAAGTVIVKDIAAGTNGSAPCELSAVGGADYSSRSVTICGNPVEPRPRPSWSRSLDSSIKSTTSTARRLFGSTMNSFSKMPSGRVTAPAQARCSCMKSTQTPFTILPTTKPSPAVICSTTPVAPKGREPSCG